MRYSRLFRITVILTIVLVSVISTGALAAPLKVCAAENELPYSNRKQEGFENRIAGLVADHLGRSLEYVWWKDPRYYVRDYLNKGLCDLVIGLDTGDPRVLTTFPYYRSGYTFITRESDGPAIQQWDDPRLREFRKIAFIPNTPVEVMIRTIGRYSEMFNYMHELVNFKSRRNQYVRYDPERLVNEVAAGKAELAVLWAPSAARYVHSADRELAMTVIPDNNTRSDGESVPHHFSTSFAVRKDNPELLAQLNQSIRVLQPQIDAILTEEGIPMLDISEGQLTVKN